MKNPLDPAELKTAIDNVHRAGMPGVFAEVRDGDRVWRGVADVSNGHPVTPDLRHRVGSIIKTFTDRKSAADPFCDKTDVLNTQ